MLAVRKSPKLGLDIITPNTIYEDYRGKYTEIYNQEIYKNNKIELNFIQDDYSYSRYNVLRGIHGDVETWKLISCLHGAFFLMVIDNQPVSKTYKELEFFTLSAANRLQVLVPPGFGNGHYVLSREGTIFHYKQTSYYNREGQFTIIWDDPSLNMFWPCSDPIVSERDSA